jgi:hypothetical protein
VTDSFTPKQEVSRAFTLVVASGVSITTTTILPATQNVEYRFQLQGTGTGSLTWLVTGGVLPAGLRLTTGGLIEGTPTELGPQTFTVTLTDSRGIRATRDFTLSVNPPIPTLSVPGLPATSGPRQVFDVTLTMADGHPSPLSGQLKLTFTPNAEVASDDPMTQFSTGTRSEKFTIAANERTAVFTTPTRLMLLTGTVAGTVKLTATFDDGPADVAVNTLEIPSAPPQITDLTAVRTTGGLNVQMTGFSLARRVANVEFSFDVRVGETTERVTLTRSVDAEFGDWYRNPSSTAFGSSFSFLQSFAVEGDVNAIEGVTVRLTNAQGTTTSSTVRPN